MLPFVKAWDCKGKHLFFNLQIFSAFFSKDLDIINIEARSHLLAVRSIKTTLALAVQLIATSFCASLALERLNKDLNLGPHD